MIDEMRKGFELPVTAAADVGEVSVGLNRQEGVAEEDERVGGGGGRDARGRGADGGGGGCVGGEEEDGRLAESKMMTAYCSYYDGASRERDWEAPKLFNPVLSLITEQT